MVKTFCFEYTSRFGSSWIGLSAQDPNAGYVWTDGSPVSFQHWNDGEPNNYNGAESCVEMDNRYRSSSTWNDVNCEDYKDWLCEIRKGVTPLPPANNTVPEYNVTEDGWLEYGGSQYYFNSQLLAMEDARDYCRQRHGDLAVINGLRENVFLWKKINKEGLGNHYIGLTVDLDRTFGWMDGSPVVFQRWDTDQPDFKNNDENCVVMTTSMGFWHDYNCGTEMRSICERSGSTPPNSTVAPTDPPTGGCAPGSTRYQSKCYTLIEYRNPTTWLEARSYCQSIGANLASIANRQEQVFLTTQMVHVTTDLWIGLTKLGRDSLVWTDGRALKYFNWAPKKNSPNPRLRWPSHLDYYNPRSLHRHFISRDIFQDYDWMEDQIFQRRNDQCAVMSSSSSTLGQWVLVSCEDKHGFICQRKVDPGIPVKAPTEFPRSWEKFGNDSYKVLPQNLTWSEAQLQCETEQSQLASILDELSAAYLELQALKLQTPLWIGLNKNETKGYFRWIDGWHLSKVKWGLMEPSRDRPCVYLDLDGTWKTAFCHHTYPSVCKQSTAIPPTDPPQYPGDCHQQELEGTSWLPFRGHCYGFFTDDIEWPDASTSCVRKGALLVSIEDPVELDFLKRNLEFLKDRYRSFWIGLYKTHLGQWQWLDRTVLDFTNWADGQPSDYSGNSEYGMMLTSDGTWSSGARWHDKPYICKKPKVLPETPPTKAVPLKADQKRVRYGLAVVVVLAALCLMGLTAGTLYKKMGRAPSADSSFSKFLVFRKPLFSAALKAFDNPLYVEPVTTGDMVNTNIIDTSQLVENMEEEPQTMS